MEVRSDAKKVDFVDDIDFLQGAFDFGVTVDDGIKELVDNSLDANAVRIFIELNTNKDGEITLIVTDDGDGIPAEFEGVEGIPHVMAFGNTEISFLQSLESTELASLVLVYRIQ